MLLSPSWIASGEGSQEERKWGEERGRREGGRNENKEKEKLALKNYQWSCLLQPNVSYFRKVVHEYHCPYKNGLCICRAHSLGHICQSDNHPQEVSRSCLSVSCIDIKCVHNFLWLNKNTYLDYWKK